MEDNQQKKRKKKQSLLPPTVTYIEIALCEVAWFWGAVFPSDTNTCAITKAKRK